MVKKFNKISDYIIEDTNDIDGLKYYPNFIEKEHANSLLKVLFNLDYKIVNKKPTKYFGVNYTHNKKKHTDKLQVLPHFFNLMKPVGLHFDQLEIKYFKKGEGHSYMSESDLFGNGILIVSFNSHYLLRFKKDDIIKEILIEPNSLLSISGEARKYSRLIPYKIKDRYCNKIFERKDMFIFTFRNINI